MSVNPDLVIPVADVTGAPLETLPGDPAEMGAASGAPVAPDAEMTEPEPPLVSVQLRALVLSPDASVIIGKGGKHINELRSESGARLLISPSVPNSQERILTVSGPLDAVSRAFGLLVRRINDEPFSQPSLPGSRPYTVRFLVPNSRMGSVIGKGGSKIKEIQEVSGARVTAGADMLPASTERILSISGVADAVHIATYYAGLVLAENSDRGANSNIQYRPGADAAASYPGAFFAGAAPGAPVAAPFGIPPMATGTPLPAGSQTQQIYIPDNLVGSVIGKGGSKINEIRTASSTHIRIENSVPGAGAAERLVTITGPPPNLQIAVNMLHQRVEEERHRLQTSQ